VWRARFAAARERLAVADALAWREGHRATVVHGVAVRMRTREQVLTPQLEQAARALLELEDTFRRTGLPAAWGLEP
jgi:hypothetical protein